MISAEIKELGNNHMALVQELMHPAAFGASSPLGERAKAHPATTLMALMSVSYVA